MNKIITLPTYMINQISAGEVVERPYSIIKELVENSLDAKATKIQVTIKNGGKTLITVTDNGDGISYEDLSLCLKPHTTSKLIKDDLFDIHTLGFRGEALASIASVSKVIINSKTADQELGYSLFCTGGNEENIIPSPIQKGTFIKISDLFFSVPARLKFLRTDQVESVYCYKIFKRLALSHPSVSFKLENNGKLIFDYPMQLADSAENQYEIYKNRIAQVFGKEFIENCLFINEQANDMKFYGFLGLPTYHTNHGEDQYFIINSRSVKDRFLTGIARAAYQDFVPTGRQPRYCIFIDIPPAEIDVNVNPTKSEIRFKDIAFIKHLLFNTLKQNLSNPANQQINNKLAPQLLDKAYNFLNSALEEIAGPNMPISSASSKESIKTNQLNKYVPKNTFSTRSFNSQLWPLQAKVTQDQKNDDLYYPAAKPTTSANQLFDNSLKQYSSTNETQLLQTSLHEDQLPLGVPKAQIHKNWIISQSAKGLIIIDQHAAHERIVEEKLKTQRQNNKLIKQILLIPEIIELDAEENHLLETYKEQLTSLGIIFDTFGKNVILVTQYPAILGNININNLVKEIVADLRSFEQLNQLPALENKLNRIIKTLACHNSIRAGKDLSHKEMEELLRIMEQTQGYGQCSHGRPTFIEISLTDIEKLFGRK
ncbi:DNA mismatch repair protein MutL [Candidatus Hepatincolaceae symbiont of Richtersius coronifer]